MRARLVLEDGSVFSGTGFGVEGEAFGEVVFNTGMTGYQEILTDPSYYGQIVALTYPLVGNYGCNMDDVESIKPHVRGFVVREEAPVPSHHASQLSLQEYLRRENVIGLAGVDTRRLTRILRTRGTLRGVIATTGAPDGELVERARAYIPETDPVARVTVKEPYRVPGEGQRIVLLDYGSKIGVVRSLRARGCDVVVLPAGATAEEILAWKPRGVMMSNGPGDPADLPGAAATVRELLGQVPVFGICLGHQVLALACGGRTEKLKFGHRGVNHPVKDLRTGRVYMTSQNHGYVVRPESLEGLPLTVSHVNQNDGTVEGLRHAEFPAFSVQYHPEARPGPDDSDYLFDEFMDEVRRFWGEAEHHAQAR